MNRHLNAISGLQGRVKRAMGRFAARNLPPTTGAEKLLLLEFFKFSMIILGLGGVATPVIAQEITPILTKSETVKDPLLELRGEIDQVNRELASLLSKRLQIALKVAEVKKERNLPIFDLTREQEIKAKMGKIAQESGVSEDYMESIFQAIFESTRAEMAKVYQ